MTYGQGKRSSQQKKGLDKKKAKKDSGEELNVVVPPPSLEITDATGNVLAGVQTKIVGQKVELRVRVSRGGLAMTDIQWTIPGETVKTYTQSVDAGTKTVLAAGDKQQDHLTFYWISGGPKLVQVSATVGGRNLLASVSFNVLAPTNPSCTSKTGDVAVGNPGFPGAGLELHYGTNITSGIEWTCKAKAPAGGAGEIAATQLVNSERTRTPNAGGKKTLSTGGDWHLDTTVPYEPAVPILAGASATWTANDTPGALLTSGYEKRTLSDRFRLYFMYKPDGIDSIWVTLQRLDWNWGGKTTRVGAPAGPGNNWNPPTDVDDTPDPDGADSTELPTWTANIKDATFK